MNKKTKSRSDKSDNRFPEYISSRLQKWGFETECYYDKFIGKDKVQFRCRYLTGQIDACRPFNVRVVISKNYDIPALPIAHGFITSAPFKRVDDALSFIKKWFVALV